MQLDYFGVLKRAAEITRKYRFLWVLGILVAMATSGGNSSNSINAKFSGADTGQAPSSLGGISAFTYDRWSETSSNSDLAYIASNYDLLVADGYAWYDSKVGYLKSLNPNLTVIFYINSLSIYDTSSDWNDISLNHDSWFLKDAAGQRIYASSYSHEWVMDPANAEWRAYIQQKVAAQANNNGYDGAMLDGACSWISTGSGGFSGWPINPRTGLAIQMRNGGLTSETSLGLSNKA